MEPISYSFFIAYLLGLFMVIASSAEVFNQPSYQMEEHKYYTKVKPKFITLKRKYRQTLMFYLLIMGVLFTAISFFPDFAKALLLDEAQKQELDRMAGSPAFPLLAASLLLGFQNAYYLKNFEEKFRRLLHRWAKIPSGARDTIDSLKGAKFDFSKYKKEDVIKQKEFVGVKMEDFDAKFSAVQTKWAKICCLVFSFRLSEECSFDEFQPIMAGCYGANFFEEYRQEYDEIIRMHRSLSYAVANIMNESDSSADKILHDDLHELLDRIYTFIACAVKSHKSTDSEVLTKLGQLGFKFAPLPARTAVLHPMIKLSGFIASAVLIILLVSEVFLAGLFSSDLTKNLPFFPRSFTDTLFWAIGATFFLGASALMALAYRRSSRKRNKWKPPDHEEDERPVPKYLISAVIGGVTGYFITILLGSMDLVVSSWLHLEKTYGDTFLGIVVNNLVWIIVSAATAVFAVYHYDTYFSEKSKSTFVKEALIQAITMAGLAFISALAYTEIWKTFNQYPYLDSYSRIALAFSGLIAFILLCIGGFMGYLFPSNKRNSQFRIVKMIPSFDETVLPEGLSVFEGSREIGKTGQWLKLFIRDYILCVVSDELGKSDPIPVNPGMSSEGKLKLSCSF